MLFAKKKMVQVHALVSLNTLVILTQPACLSALKIQTAIDQKLVSTKSAKILVQACAVKMHNVTLLITLRVVNVCRD